VVTLIVIFATISVGRAAERAKKLEAERDKGCWVSGARRSSTGELSTPALGKLIAPVRTGLLPAGKVGPAHSFC
jgi:hypothetical protein